ncbi:MAG: lysine--tRNA ligase, partial [Lachnospiraceae bacterium]|nr:lysine--tRNA ligase [Lachnospiraceae bacterium]
MAQQNNNEQQVDVKQLLKVRRDKLAELQANGNDPFQITKYDVTHHSEEIKAHFDELEAQHDEEGKLIKDDTKLVSIAGRIMLKRVMGKASFCNVQDRDGNIQVYIARNELGEEPW